MQTITVINQKGGVGKSTTAQALGTGFILKGYRTLFVDLDAQGNLSYSMEANYSSHYILNALCKPRSIRQEIQHSEQGDILASTPELSNIDDFISGDDKEYRLKQSLKIVAKEYDYCIIDTPPSLGILTINALSASDGAIIPAQADIYSLQGINQLNGTIETVKTYCNPSLNIMGIVLTRFNKRSIIRREVAEMLEQIATQLNTKLYKTKIRECTALVEAQAKQQSIYKYSPKCNAAADYISLVNEILKGEES